MKAALLLGLIALFMFTACGRNNNHDEAADYIIQNLLLEKAEMESIIRRLESELLREEPPPPPRFWHGTEDRVRESFVYFFDNSGIADELQEILGMTFSSDDFGEILIGNHYVLAGVAHWSGVHFLFNYSVDHEYNITWRVIGYDVYWLNNPAFNSYLVRPDIPPFTVIRPPAAPRVLTDEEYVTVRFYHFPDEAPYYRPHQYTEETIAGENLWEEAIRLSREHGFHVRDLWYEGSTLYVDLKLAANFAFRVGFFCTVWAMAMVETFYSFPGVTEVIFLLDGGEMPLIYNHFSINNPRGFHFQE